ncbi:YciI family protein [Tardiphaga sp. 709]|uniref:YciI family protein n=1 Tax=Tardiphaga sp. 709 TaxID=3076039 RepID=UPI0028E48FBF|nr:YciI family protein [Tardiphaga sp. 709]WNV08625.1 YciI family protein [Tardiphaga sp. 709]
MLYAILAYHVEDVVVSWTADQDTAVMAGLHEIHEKLTADGQMGPAARLGGTKGAFTLRGPGAGVVIDGPFAETKEQLLGFYVVDRATREDAIATARDLRRVNPTAVYEIRPVQLFLPGSPMAATHALTDHVRPASP